MTTVREVYADAEFRPDLYGIPGIGSIGLVDAADTSYYAVNADMDQEAIRAWSPPFMEEQVWPHFPLRADGSLDLDHPDVKPAATIAAELEAYFTRTTAAKTKLFAYYGKDDLACIHALFGNNWATMPSAIPRTFIDLAELADDAGDALILPEQTTPKHHALNDARHDRDMHRTIKAALQEQSIPLQRALEIVAGAFDRSGYGFPVDFDIIDEELGEIADKTAGTIDRDQWYERFPNAAMGHAVTMVSALREILGMSNTPTMRERNERARAAKEEAARATREKFEAKVPFVGGPYDGLTLSIEYTPFGPHMGPPYFMPMSYNSERCISSCQYGRKVTLEKGKPMWRMELTDKFTPPADAQPYFTEVEKATQGL